MGGRATSEENRDWEKLLLSYTVAYTVASGGCPCRSRALALGEGFTWDLGGCLATLRHGTCWAIMSIQPHKACAVLSV